MVGGAERDAVQRPPTLHERNTGQHHKASLSADTVSRFTKHSVKHAAEQAGRVVDRYKNEYAHASQPIRAFKRNGLEMIQQHVQDLAHSSYIKASDQYASLKSAHSQLMKMPVEMTSNLSDMELSLIRGTSDLQKRSREALGAERSDWLVQYRLNEQLLNDPNRTLSADQVEQLTAQQIEIVKKARIAAEHHQVMLNTSLLDHWPEISAVVLVIAVVWWLWNTLENKIRQCLGLQGGTGVPCAFLCECVGGSIGCCIGLLGRCLSWWATSDTSSTHRQPIPYFPNPIATKYFERDESMRRSKYSHEEPFQLHV
eukprot:CAMPEP_0114240860 /NCGR_PEP_ID=MMETSP0058-20121206/9327_1 /TAXON_ID=36894 /ORGANISM="Pyramimonas parkeae, CCMP726" /LENGTH=312 /DNA_ID=CAMNT_0001353353 /DNA_START=606 /DNA_END=1544 /DNA_ORIENTATION=+